MAGAVPHVQPSLPGTALSAAPSVPFWPAAPTSPGERFHFSASSRQTLPLVLGGIVLRVGHMQLPLSPLQEEEREPARRPCQLALLTRPVEGATEKCLPGGCCSLAWWVLWEAPPAWPLPQLSPWCTAQVGLGSHFPSFALPLGPSLRPQGPLQSFPIFFFF